MIAPVTLNPGLNSMSDTQKLLIWLPLRPGSAWRGEGIAQTVEQIVSNLSPLIRVEILTTPECAVAFDEKLKSRCKIHTLRLAGKSRKVVSLTANESLTPSLIDLLAAKLGVKKFMRLSDILTLPLYIIELKWLCFQINHNRKFSNFDYFWFPAPNIYGIKGLRVRKVISFWDPFVFEYRDFGDVANVLYPMFFETYRSADKIVTQSGTNKDYLVNVMNLNSTKVHVINNGSPDYSPYKRSQNELSNENILRLWAKGHYQGQDKSSAIASFVKDKINHSILWRLLQKRQGSACKIVLISTQDRPYKGIALLMEIFNLYLQRYTEDIQIIFTTELQPEHRKKYPALVNRLHEITRVSQAQHALLHSISDLAIHPSFVEGGLGAYPQFEAESLDRPSLVNRGRHIDEMIRAGMLNDSEVEIISADFTNKDFACQKINILLTVPQAAEENIECIRKCRVSWTDSGALYSKLFSS